MKKDEFEKKVEQLLEDNDSKFEEGINNNRRFADTCENLILDIFNCYNPFTKCFEGKKLDSVMSKAIKCKISDSCVFFSENDLVVSMTFEEKLIGTSLENESINLNILKSMLLDDKIISSFEIKNSKKFITNDWEELEEIPFIVITVKADASKFLNDSQMIINSKMRVRKPEY